ncbi:hypothetical protein [Flammeovirga sp. MY04]|uniref:hypothetical protein n=1 Tax=Flammeovirga sp. MY04 TaxID=1191459 RepID=UPI00130541B2|nr:hypothetical protein [Flammeovirga sp. MY04]
MGLVFYSEWNGQLQHAKSVTGIPTTDLIDQQILQVQETINESSKHTVNGKTNWAKYQTFLDSQKQLRKLEEKREAQLLLIDDKLVEAENTANNFRVFSIVLFVLAFLASSVNHDTIDSSLKEVKYDLEEEIDEQKLKVISLIKKGEINSVKMLMDYFNMQLKEAEYLFEKFSPKSKFGLKAS